MEENIKIPSKEEVSQFLDLNVENVNKVFLYAKADLEGNILVDSEVAKQEKLGPLMKAVTLREEGTSSETPVYLNLLRLVVVRGTVIGFFQQLQISFWNKGLKKEDPLYTKAVLKDLIGLKACDGKTNVIKLKNKAGKEEFVSASLLRKALVCQRACNDSGYGNCFGVCFRKREQLRRECWGNCVYTAVRRYHWNDRCDRAGTEKEI